MEDTKRTQKALLAKSGGDAQTLLKKLEELKLADPGWYYAFHVEDSTNQLAQLLWMSPDQTNLAARYGNIIILDNSENRTLFDMALTIFLVVDSNFNSRTIAYGLATSRNADMYTWAFQNLECNLQHPPKVLFSDHDLALEVAVESFWPATFHGLCLWHIEKNIKDNLGGILRHRFPEFMKQFWRVYRTGSKKSFLNEWNRLITAWPRAAKYLQSYIFPVHTKWAWAWVGTHFVAGLRTTGRVEVEHSITKALGLGLNTSLNRLFDILNDRTFQQKELSELMHYQVFFSFIFNVQ
jgi:MULE transposase domain